MNCSRRRWLNRTLCSTAGVALAEALAPVLAAAETRTYRIGACEWSLQKSDPSCMAVARELGLDGVQLSMGTLANNMWLQRPDVRRAYKSAARENRMRISGLALAELNNIPLKSDPRAAVWLVESIEVAVGLGVKAILVAQFFKGDLVGDAEGVRRTIEILRAAAPCAERAGVILGLENYLSAEANLDILAQVGSPAVQVYYDVGNSTDKGYDVYAEIRRLKGKICEFHFKDAGYLLGKGRIDFAQVHAAIAAIEFTGWIQIEAAAPNGLRKDYPTDLAYLRTFFPKE